MKIKKNYSSAALAALILSSGNVLALSDPFIKQWVYFDGVNKYILDIQKSRAPGKDYSIYYTFLGGSSSTDLCQLTSDASFSCETGETITRDDAAYAVKLSTRDTNYTFYDANHLPPASDIFGNWNWRIRGSVFTITVLKGSSDTEYNILTSFSDDRGNHCSYSDPTPYKVTKNPDGSEIITYVKQYGQYSFKYDPNKAQIINPKLNDDFYVGFCIEGIPSSNQAVFTKN